MSPLENAEITEFQRDSHLVVANVYQVSKDEAELLEVFRRLDTDKRVLLLGVTRELAQFTPASEDQG